jgi:capsular exopolysaccharide synthesis family protein
MSTTIDTRLGRRAALPPRHRANLDEHLASLLAPTSFEAEQYRVLRHCVEQVERLNGHKIFVITSAAEGEGKTTTAINLAGSLARCPGARVLLIDGDLRRPSVGPSLGMGDGCGPGLAGALAGSGIPLESVIRNRSAYNLWVLPAGSTSEVPYELLRSHRLGELLQEARNTFDTIIIDTPPLLLAPDCRVLTRWIDAFLVVVAAHRTPRKLLEETLNILEPAKVLGIVFNNDDRPLAGYYSKYYSRYYSQSLKASAVSSPPSGAGGARDDAAVPAGVRRSEISS